MVQKGWRNLKEIKALCVVKITYCTNLGSPFYYIHHRYITIIHTSSTYNPCSTRACHLWHSCREGGLQLHPSSHSITSATPKHVSRYVTLSEDREYSPVALCLHYLLILLFTNPFRRPVQWIFRSLVTVLWGHWISDCLPPPPPKTKRCKQSSVQQTNRLYVYNHIKLF